ncbi:MAG: NUDIX domain-containing protein [Mycoplasmataceae bacterium]|nr:NUDIX domain-containing protein [Mycoplasmataceae bacterium]
MLFTLILIIDKKKENILMCVRNKEPFKGLYNGLGGKIEKGESVLLSAYRELFEESGISKKDTKLTQYCEIKWKNDKVVVFFGKLNKQVKLIEEVNKLVWLNIKKTDVSSEKFAGNGNLFWLIKECIKTIK